MRPNRDIDSYDNLRGNQEVFLACIADNDEFKTIRNKYLKNVFMGIYQLLHGVSGDYENCKKVLACANEISAVLHISKENALRLLIMPSQAALRGMRYIPKVSRDGNEIVVQIGAKTTQADIKSVWSAIKDLQREIGDIGTKNSINPELAFCIHRQYVLEHRKKSEIFNDYQNGHLEGYSHTPTITYEEDFRKYYKQVVKGL